MVGEQIEAGAAQASTASRARPESFDQLHELLESQPYRLSYWRTASHEINYRRFFDVNTLAGLRVERPEVFGATHKLLETLLRDGIVDAVRIDHPDGLFDPARYFEMLQELAARAWHIERRQGGRTATTSAVRGRREDPVGSGGAAAPMGRFTARPATTT